MPSSKKECHDTLRSNLLYQLDRLGLTQRELARELGIAPSTMSDILRGMYSPDIYLIKRMSELFHTPIDALVRPSKTRKLHPAVLESNNGKKLAHS